MAYERMNVADALVSQQFSAEQLIIQQGDDADCMYFIEDGQVRFTVKPHANADDQEVARCHKGDYFGELSLVTHKPRAASAFAVTPTRCAVLDVAAFERLLGPCMDVNTVKEQESLRCLCCPCMEVLKRNVGNYEQQLVEKFGSGLAALGNSTEHTN